MVNRQNQRARPYLAEPTLHTNTTPALGAEGAALAPSTSLGPTNTSDTVNSVVMPWDSMQIKGDIVRIISQWLADEGFGAARQALLEEAGIKSREREDNMAEHRKLRNYLLEGNWQEVDKMCSKPVLKEHKAFLYAIYKQQFLEHIEHREFQKVRPRHSPGIHVFNQTAQTA